MNLEISSYADSGNLNSERLVLKAKVDLDIGKYAVFCTALSETKGATAGKKLAYWFPDTAVKAGDSVVLYTKAGSSSKKDLASGLTAHFYYWGETGALWKGKNNAAVLLKVETWVKSVPED